MKTEKEINFLLQKAIEHQPYATSLGGLAGNLMMQDVCRYILDQDPGKAFNSLVAGFQEEDTE